MTKETRKARDDGLAHKITPDDVNKTIDEAISAFANERFKEGIEALEELAQWYKGAGSSRETFGDLCRYIESEAVEEAGSPIALRVTIVHEIRAHFAAKAAGKGKIYMPPARVPVLENVVALRKSSKE